MEVSCKTNYKQQEYQHKIEMYHCYHQLVLMRKRFSKNKFSMKQLFEMKIERFLKIQSKISNDCTDQFLSKELRL